MKTLFFTLVFLTFTLFSGALSAQKKSETKFYKATIAKGDTTSFNQFLAKYPKSVYAKQILFKKDSLIKRANTTCLTLQQADSIFTSVVPGLENKTSGTDFIAWPKRKNNIEYITGIIPPSNNKPGFYSIITLKEEQGTWSIFSDRKENRYIQDDALKLFVFVPLVSSGSADNNNLREVIINGEKYVHFNYQNYTKAFYPRSKWKNNNVEFVTNLLSLSEGTLYSAMFSGEENGAEIEGSCRDASQGGALSIPQMDYLIGYIKEQDRLKPFSKEKVLTKEAIEWWYNNNPEGKNTLTFGVLEKEHPIIEKFIATKEKERSASNTAAFFNIMETTVLCVYSKATQQYLLVWCEPQVANPQTDKTLNTIYFEKDNSLVLYYYKGKNAIKERINLSNKQKR